MPRCGEGPTGKEGETLDETPGGMRSMNGLRGFMPGAAGQNRGPWPFEQPRHAKNAPVGAMPTGAEHLIIYPYGAINLM